MITRNVVIETDASSLLCLARSQPSSPSPPDRWSCKFFCRIQYYLIFFTTHRRRVQSSPVAGYVTKETSIYFVTVNDIKSNEDRAEHFGLFNWSGSNSDNDIKFLVGFRIPSTLTIVKYTVVDTKIPTGIICAIRFHIAMKKKLKINRFIALLISL